jgi:hypothetical protein
MCLTLPGTAARSARHAQRREGWRVPTLNLDATVDIEMLRLRVAAAEVAAIEAQAPSMRAVQ